MKPSQYDLLLDAALPAPSFEDSLAATRRAARQRRTRRRLARGSIALLLLLAPLGWLAVPHHPTRPAGQSVMSQPVAPPAFIRVTSRPSVALVQSRPDQHSLILTRRKAEVVVTTTRTPRITTEELFALAGQRPMALHYLPNGQARWLFLDGLR